jgi:hypothetical protein
MNFLKTTTVLGITTAGLFSCEMKLQSAAEKISQSESGASISSLKVNVNKYSSNKLVCDPFNTPEVITSTAYQKGLKASLHYLDAGMPRLYKATDYVQFGKKSDKTVFLTDVNVPTRMFTEGFSTPSGQTLAKDSGEKLIEFFGLKMTSNLILTDLDEPGEYELAMLADDGSNLILKSGDGDNADELIINNDGDHPTRMGCANRTIRIVRNALLPIEITYYQGPKYHISNVLMWRKSTTAGQDPSCGKLGNNLFFNPNNKSEPQQAYKDLEARGWKVLKPDNFVVSVDKVDYNPCVKGTNPVITQFVVGEIVDQLVDLYFTTDVPATAQIQLTNQTTGAVTTTTSDNILRTNHMIRLTGLQPNTTYKAQAVSVSADLGRTISSEITFITQ